MKIIKLYVYMFMYYQMCSIITLTNIFILTVYVFQPGYVEEQSDDENIAECLVDKKAGAWPSGVVSTLYRLSQSFLKIKKAKRITIKEVRYYNCTNIKNTKSFISPDSFHCRFSLNCEDTIQIEFMNMYKYKHERYK